MHCWKCKKPISNEPVKIGFRAECPLCSADLHVCMNCKHHVPGKPNECAIPGTDPVRDREKANFCEEFQVKVFSNTASSDALERARRLLGLNEPET